MAKSHRSNILSRNIAFDCVNGGIILLLSASFLYPLLLTLSISVSDPKLADVQKIVLLPKGWSLDSYLFLLTDGRILRYYANSVFYAVAGTFVFLLFTSMMAYPLIVKNFKLRKFLNLYMIVTMFFSGGLIPYYFVVRTLGMINTVWVMIIPGAVSALTVIIFRTFFNQIPAGLLESAVIDGAGHYTVLFRILLPVSKPLLATFALFCMVDKWNDYFTAMLFIRNDNLLPIQMILRRMLVLFDFLDMKSMGIQQMFTAISPRSVKCAAVIITILPIVCVYPFLQKYFAKGIMIGSIKS